MPTASQYMTTIITNAVLYATYAKRRNSILENEDNSPSHLRRDSYPIDHAWDPRLQPEFLWRRNHGVSFSHNSEPKFPTTHSDLGQTSK
ncbi:hypothetical protein G6F61_008071 [Rhizopus arrhizus]|uniref:Uncharacterized protein n=1 Tax=Rhizopus oryzae TaxID=64495 RepID=A0A9P6XJL0_RHIOR|nr:hypothetical protein G6F42_006217 [Rhizopus arrhizus]KAG1315195.1 hypothetical protein G6F64_000872 [Rhizopus arrhizus]KAG1375898.1 hypothetical protein G6F61_008071 [Rhizopus arrhizus]